MMEAKVIQNQYDGPQAPATRPASGRFSLDYADSDNAKEIDSGIRETIKGIRLSILAMGIGLAKIKNQGLFTDLDYHSMNDYIESLGDEMQMERSTIHNWLYIGEAYIKYRRELERIAFTDEDGPTKLRYVERALEFYEKKEVFKNVKEMSARQFIAFSKGENEAAPRSKIRVAGNRVYVGKKLAVTLADELDPKTRNYFIKITSEAGEALEAGEVLFTTRLYDMDELRRFQKAAERVKKELRVEYKGKARRK
jgi:hypothetical protein